MDMDGKIGQSSPDLIQQLFERAEEFEFFQAVQLLESYAREDSSAGKSGEIDHGTVRGGAVGLKPLGTAASPKQEPIRFRTQPSRTFPAGDITSVQQAKNPRGRGANAAGQKGTDSGEASEGTAAERASAGGVSYPVEMTVPFMGLTGPNGVMPEHYSTLVVERAHQKYKDHSLREFFDLFNHRAISLFYLAWRKHRICEEYLRMRNEGKAGEDRFTQALLSVVGFGLRELRSRVAFSDEVFLYYGGLFANQQRSAIGLEQILCDYLGLRVRVEEFRGRWLYLPTEVQTSFPNVRQPEGLNLNLGQSAVAGSRAWDRQSLFRVTIGPLNRRQFNELLPGTPGLRVIEQLIRTYAGVALDFEVQLILKASDVPACQLVGLSGESSSRPSLGWTTWLGKAMIPVDSGDAVFRFSGIPSSC